MRGNMDQENTDTFHAVSNITVPNKFSTRLVSRLLTFALVYLVF